MRTDGQTNGRTEERTERQAEMTTPKVASRNFANGLEKHFERIRLGKLYI